MIVELSREQLEKLKTLCCGAHESGQYTALDAADFLDMWDKAYEAIGKNQIRFSEGKIYVKPRRSLAIPWEQCMARMFVVDSAAHADLVARALLHKEVVEVRWNWAGTLQGYYVSKGTSHA